MPDQTPIYSFPYPCANEVVSKTHFQNFALAVDEACSNLNYLATMSDRRPAAKIYNQSDAQPLPVGSATTLTFDTVVFDNSSMTELISSNGLRIKTAGVYLVEANVVALNDTPNQLSILAEVRLNANTIYGRRHQARAGIYGDAYSSVSIVLAYPFAVNDFLTFTINTEGAAASTGGIRSIAASMLCRA